MALWFSSFAMVFLGGFYGFLWFSRVFLWSSRVLLWFSRGFLWFSRGLRASTKS